MNGEIQIVKAATELQARITK